MIPMITIIIIMMIPLETRNGIEEKYGNYILNKCAHLIGLACGV
jgi:hypothetical protein